MDKKVFDNRKSSAYFVVGFLGFWSLAWTSMTLASVFKGSINFNDVETPINKAIPLISGLLFIGLAVGALAAAALAYSLNARIEIEGDNITVIDIFGKAKVKGMLSQTKIINAKAGVSHASYLKAELGGKTFRISKQLRNFGSLLQILREKASELPVSMRRDRPNADYIPEEKVYSYRWTPWFFFAIPWTAFVVFFLIGFSIQTLARGGAGAVLSLLFGWGICFILGGVGVWLLLSSWNENIKLGPDGLVWTNWLGKKMAECPLNEILDTQDDLDSEGSTLSIFTLQGTVPVRSYIKNFSHLKGEINAILGKSN